MTRRSLAEEEEEIRQGLHCICGDLIGKHVYRRARCTVEGCGCVRFQAKDVASLLRRALALDECLEAAEAELKRTKALLRMVMDDEEVPHADIVKDNERLRELAREIVKDPLSARGHAQGIALRMLETRGRREG